MRCLVEENAVDSQSFVDIGPASVRANIPQNVVDVSVCIAGANIAKRLDIRVRIELLDGGNVGI